MNNIPIPRTYCFLEKSFYGFRYLGHVGVWSYVDRHFPIYLYRKYKSTLNFRLKRIAWFGVLLAVNERRKFENPVNELFPLSRRRIYKVLSARIKYQQGLRRFMSSPRLYTLFLTHDVSQWRLHYNYLSL